MAEEFRRLPIGVQSFEIMRQENFLYVDKTSYVYRLAHSGRQYFLSRPRRFGKSLFLSTLKAYWEGRKELFEGLEIEKLEQGNDEAWQPYPVFYFDFNGQNYQARALEDVLDGMLSEWEEIYDCDKDKAQILVIALQGAEEALEDSFVVLLQLIIFQRLQKWLVIFIYQHHAAPARFFSGCFIFTIFRLASNHKTILN